MNKTILSIFLICSIQLNSMDQTHFIATTERQDIALNRQALQTIKFYEKESCKQKLINKRFLHAGMSIVATSIILPIIQTTSPEFITSLAFTGFAITMIPEKLFQFREIVFEKYLENEALRLGISDERIQDMKDNNIIQTHNTETGHYVRSVFISDLKREVSHAIKLQELPYMTKFHKKMTNEAS